MVSHKKGNLLLDRGQCHQIGLKSLTQKYLWNHDGDLLCCKYWHSSITMMSFSFLTILKRDDIDISTVNEWDPSHPLKILWILNSQMIHFFAIALQYSFSKQSLLNLWIDYIRIKSGTSFLKKKFMCDEKLKRYVSYCSFIRYKFYYNMFRQFQNFISVFTFIVHFLLFWKSF